MGSVTTTVGLQFIAAMEPLCGASMAIGLAYLALERFRYRSQIRKLATAQLEAEICANDNVHHTTPVKTLVWLAGSKLPEGMSGKNVQSKRPEGFGPCLYGILFSRGHDELAVLATSCWAMIILIAGVCVGASSWMWLPTALATIIPPGILLFMLVSCLVLPILLVAMGRHCVAWADKQSVEMGLELSTTAETMRQAARDLPVPEVPARRHIRPAARL